MKTRKRCYAKIVLGSFVSESWIRNCEERAKGFCCKDCKSLLTCGDVCSGLMSIFEWGSKTYRLEDFHCMYWLDEVEAMVMILKTEDERRGKM